jgi:hypothetical protein
MNSGFAIGGSASYGKKTAAFGTVIQQVVRAWKRAHTRITGFKYTTTAATAHTATVRMAIGTTTLNVAAAVGATSLTLAAQPTAARNVATNDLFIVETRDTNVPTSSAGYLTYDLVKATAVAGLVITVAATAHAYDGPGAGPGPSASPTVPGSQQGLGARVWLMSLDTDNIPGYQGTTNPKYSLPNAGTGSTTEFPTNSSPLALLIGSPNRYEPLIWESNNATAAGTLEYLTAIGAVFEPGTGE